MSDKQTLQSQITQLKTLLASPKTDGSTRKIFEGGLKKAESKLAELEKAEKLESSKKELTPKQEAKVEEVKKETKSLAQSLKEKVAKAKQKIATITPKATTKKGGARSVAKAKELAKARRSTQKKQSLSDKDIESDANRHAINKSKRRSSGGRANQYGTKAENKGGVYYEKRENRFDVQNKRYAKLEDGGMMAKGGEVLDDVEMYVKIHGYYPESVMALRGDGMGQSIIKGDRSKFELDGSDSREAEEMGYEYDYYVKGWVEKDEDDDEYADGGVTYAKGGRINKGSKYMTKYRTTNGDSGYSILEVVDTNYFSNKYGGSPNTIRTKVVESSHEKVGSFDENSRKQIQSNLKNGFWEKLDHYEDGGAINDVGGTTYSTEDLSGMMAKGGMTEHGLKIGDKVKDKFDNVVVVENDGKTFIVNLNVGKRWSENQWYTMNHGTNGRNSKMADGGVTNQGTRFESYYANGGTIGDKYTFFGTSENGWYVKDKATNKFIHPMGKSVWDTKEEAVRDLKTNKFKYADGGAINDVGGTQYSTEDLSGMFADGGRLKGSNSKTGETYGVVIGSNKKSDEYVQGGTEMNVRSGYGSRISEVKLVFDSKGNLHEIIDYGYSLDGYPSTSRGSGHKYNADKKETLKVLSEKYNPSFAKKLIESVSTKMAKGGGISKYSIIIDGDWDEPKNYKSFEIAKKWIYENYKNYDSLELVDQFGDSIQVSNEDEKKDLDWLFSDKMAKGGTTTFNDKVTSISKSLMKRKKVAPKVQKDYGKTYSKDEAIDSAKRIAGAMRKKGMAKKKS